MQYSNPSGREKTNLPTVNLDNAARIAGNWNSLQPSTPKKQQSIGRMKRSKSFQWRGASGRNYENVRHWELKNPGQGCFSSLALSCCIAGLWQLSLNSTTLWDRRGIELHSPQKVGKRCIQNHSKSFKIIVTKYLPRKFTVCLHSTLRNAALASLVVKLSEHRGFPAELREQMSWSDLVVIDKLLYPAQHQKGRKYELFRSVPSFLDLFWYSFQRLTADFQSWNYSKNSPSRYSANTCRCLAENMLALHQCYGLLRPHHFFQDSLPCLMLGPKFLLQSRFGRDPWRWKRVQLQHHPEKNHACLLLITSNEQYGRSKFKKILDLLNVFGSFCSPASTSHGDIDIPRSPCSIPWSKARHTLQTHEAAQRAGCQWPAANHVETRARQQIQLFHDMMHHDPIMMYHDAFQLSNISSPTSSSSSSSDSPPLTLDLAACWTVGCAFNFSSQQVPSHYLPQKFLPHEGTMTQARSLNSQNRGMAPSLALGLALAHPVPPFSDLSIGGAGCAENLSNSWSWQLRCFSLEPRQRSLPWGPENTSTKPSNKPQFQAMRPEVIPVSGKTETKELQGFTGFSELDFTCMQNGNIVWLLQSTMCRYSLQTYFIFFAISGSTLKDWTLSVMSLSTPSLSETNRPQTPRRLGGKLPPKKTAGLRAFEPKATPWSISENSHQSICSPRLHQWFQRWLDGTLVTNRYVAK